MLQPNFSFFSLSVFSWSWDVHNPSLLSEEACNPMCMYTYTLFKFAVLSKDHAGFPNETFFQQLCVHGKIYWSCFSSYCKIVFLFINFFLFFYFFIFAYFVNLTSLIHSHAEQCFYYKNYTSILKNAFNIQISITNSFHNLRTNVIGNLIGYLIMI